MHEFADERINLSQSGLGSAFQIAAHELVFANSQLQSGAAGIFRWRYAVLFGQRKNALNAAHAELSLMLINVLAEGADLSSRVFGSQQQLRDLVRSPGRKIPLLNAMTAAFLTKVLAQQLAGFGIEDPDEDLIPLHRDPTSDPAGRQAVVGGFDFHAAIQMDVSFAMLVITEGLEG